MYEEVKKLSCLCHLLPTLSESRINPNQVTLCLVFIFHFMNDLLEHFDEAFHIANLSDQRVKRITELMRNHGIDLL